MKKQKTTIELMQQATGQLPSDPAIWKPPLPLESECKHQFFKLNDDTKTKEENMTKVPYRWGVKVMCVLCGQQRVLWTDGEVETI